jgi:hypothetical protein
LFRRRLISRAVNPFQDLTIRSNRYGLFSLKSTCTCYVKLGITTKDATV